MNKPSKLPRLLSLLIVLFFIAAIGDQRAAAQAPATFTITGSVTDNTGHPIADALVIVISDVTGTQLAFTDQSGNYVLTYTGGVSHRLSITVSKSGYTFEPTLTIFISSSSLTGNKTQNFVGTPIPIILTIVQTPILLTQENSLHALALDSVTWASEPFGVTNPNNFSTDQHTRISLFAVNVDLAQGQLSNLEAQAETSTGQVFPLTIEFVGAVPNFTWLKQVVVKLPDEIANSNEVNVSLKTGLFTGNTVTLKLKP
jgi:uncharacterized protein (TIGR03437 family)